MRFFSTIILCLICLFGCTTKKAPNFILIYADDLGYSDIGCFGSEKNRTPAIDKMAAEGIKLTSFYSTSGVCTPSRSSLMTGCYPIRVGMDENYKGFWVLFPMDNKGLHPSEITVAEMLKDEGYATACIGKWHLGDQAEFLPTKQGFDYYFGIPYSNDMGRGDENPPLPLMRNEIVIEAPADQSLLTKRYTEEAIAFIKTNADNPFFLYLPHTMPHVPLFSSEAFAGKSNNGKYGDAIEEIDWSTGEILKTLVELGLDENTLVVFTSDNGATRRGSNLPFSGGKCGIQEGSMREPCVMWWPGTIPGGSSSSELMSTLDIFPTFASLAGGKVPEDRVIDGMDLSRVILGEEGAVSPHEVFYYYFMSQLQAVRSGNYKLYLEMEEKQYGWTRKIISAEMELFDLEKDPGEKINIVNQYPDIVSKLLTLAEKAREDMGDFERVGKNARAAGWVDNPKAQRLTKAQ
jgi:arylsulfatase A